MSDFTPNTPPEIVNDKLYELKKQQDILRQQVDNIWKAVITPNIYDARNLEDLMELFSPYKICDEDYQTTELPFPWGVNKMWSMNVMVRRDKARRKRRLRRRYKR